MILGVFIEFFGVKIVIGLSKNHCNLILTVGFDLSQNSRYLLIFTDISPIFYRYFFKNSNTCAREIKSRKFAEMSGISDISTILPIFSSTDYQLPISLQCRPITNFSTIFQPNKAIFLSLHDFLFIR